MSEQGQVSQPLRVGRKVSHTPFPTREELMKRNSVGSVNDNKYLNRIRDLDNESRQEEYERRLKEWD